MLRPGFVMLLSVGWAACSAGGEASAPAEQAAPAAELADYSACSTAAEPEACVQQVERVAMERAGGRVYREGDTLWIETAEGGPMPLFNQSGGDGYLSYRYLGEVESVGSHVLRVSFYEGGSYVLVSSRTGNQTPVLSPPVVAPSGERFATESLDLIAGYEPNGLQVWRVTEYGPRLEWGVMGGETWGASDLVWVDEELLEFTRHIVVPGEPEPRQSRMRLTLSEGGLEVRPAE